MTTLTDWYDPKVDGQPVRVGWYQRNYAEWGDDVGEALMKIQDYWDGQHWFLGCGNADQHTGTRDQHHMLPWRGLTEPNEEKQ